ncbi:hypothetical protein HPB50_020150 [Hyalomma asiaticum]|uniref:Uncharacterized protein n=1 Tax=Hyalomma asiaticum TaxID=266040 RepID=A0ACB7TKT2_HYAAI|nr:hypothetical protein HPB50_020150 [Hyalomma asiaticum]
MRCPCVRPLRRRAAAQHRCGSGRPLRGRRELRETQVDTSRIALLIDVRHYVPARHVYLCVYFAPVLNTRTGGTVAADCCGSHVTDQCAS